MNKTIMGLLAVALVASPGLASTGADVADRIMNPSNVVEGPTTHPLDTIAGRDDGRRLEGVDITDIGLQADLPTKFSPYFTK